MLALLRKLNPTVVFMAFAILTTLSILGAVTFDNPYLYLLPFVLLTALFFIGAFKSAYVLLFLCLPISIEVELGSGFSTDLPTEPLMVLLMFVGILYYLSNPKQLSKKFLNHPILVLLLAHLVWIGIAMLYSQLFVVSLKFFLAKIWYITVFVFLTALFIKEHRDFEPILWSLLIPFIFVIVQTIIRHWLMDFGFQEANKTMQPFFRNHVNYAVMMVVLIPYIWFAREWYVKGSLVRLFLNISLVVFIIGIIFAYTRAAYVSLVLIPFLIWMFKRRLSKWFALFGLGILLLFLGYYSNDYRYLDLAPDFETTIYHDDLDDHLVATFEGKDVSFMERVYRWVAAVRMSNEHLLTGFGPGNFYNFYQQYTIDNFETYVSDNPEKSGVHNYFLMTLTEQGLIGLVIFIALCIVFFTEGERIYQQTTNRLRKGFVMTILVSMFIVIVNLLVSDLIEVDKIGAFFFANMALLINMDVRNKEERGGDYLSCQ